MILVDDKQSNLLRVKYVDEFVNKLSSYYFNNIQHLKKYSDGLCYDGYLWDCLKNAEVVSESKADLILKEKHNIYIMWDLHSNEKILIPDYWKYPKNSILHCEKWSADFKIDLPEDIYVFDDTFSWSIVYTHEEMKPGKRYCLHIDKTIT